MCEFCFSCLLLSVIYVFIYLIWITNIFEANNWYLVDCAPFNFKHAINHIWESEINKQVLPNYIYTYIHNCRMYVPVALNSKTWFTAKNTQPCQPHAKIDDCSWNLYSVGKSPFQVTECWPENLPRKCSLLRGQTIVTSPRKNLFSERDRLMSFQMCADYLQIEWPSDWP